MTWAAAGHLQPYRAGEVGRARITTTRKNAVAAEMPKVKGQDILLDMPHHRQTSRDESGLIGVELVLEFTGHPRTRSELQMKLQELGVAGLPWSIDLSNLLRFYGCPNKLCMNTADVTGDSFGDLDEETRVVDLIENYEQHGLVVEDTLVVTRSGAGWQGRVCWIKCMMANKIK